ncbi:hypothetical protein HDU67_007562 [Dinochytrium kinnereticum]|nr:hypothetical protein HDU67_007562 [Dinochytrium kinnereticum]
MERETVNSSLLKPSSEFNAPTASKDSAGASGFARRMAGGLRSYLSSASIRMRSKGDENDDEENERLDKRNGDDDENGLAPKRMAARPGMTSSISIGMSRWPHARELSETFGLKMRYVSSILAVACLNGVLIIFALLLAKGATIKLSPTMVHYAGGVILELVLLLTNSMTVFAVDLGVSIFLAIMLTSRGYSMAACGFMQTAPFMRLSFTNELSLNSPCRKTLERVAFTWILLESLKLVSPLGATGLDAKQVRVVSSTSNCIVFDGTSLRDRNFPTFWSAAGVAEFIYGTALGCMRSEFPCTDEGSEFVFGPQLSGVIGDGDTIVGSGYHMWITSHCTCHNVTSPDVVRSGVLTATDVAAIMPVLNQSNHFVMLSSNVTSSPASNTVSFSIIPGNIRTCGGLRAEVMPVCYTEIKNLSDVTVVSTFLTDGTTASIALVDSQVREFLGTQLTHTSVMGTVMSSIMTPGKPYVLTGAVPGMINAILYWTSSDLIGVDPTLQDAGIETMVSILLRAGIQRNFKTRGSSCPKQQAVSDTSFVILRDWSVQSILVTAAIQTGMSVIALLLSLLWLFRSSPILPALQAIRNPSFFMTLLGDSPFGINLQGTGNAPRHVIWQNLDLVVKIGENVETLDENVGRIKMERAKLVRALKNGRIYA